MRSWRLLLPVLELLGSYAWFEAVPQLRRASGENGSITNQTLRGESLANLAMRLAVTTDSALPFQSGGADLFKGEAKASFDCQSIEDRAQDGASVAFRKLELSALDVSSSDSIFGNFFGGGKSGDGGSSGSLWITEAKLTTRVESGDGMPTLTVALDRQVDSDSSLEVTENADAPASLTVLYDCWREGQASVELRLRVAARADSGQQSTGVCLRWKKVCAVGFSDLRISHGNSVVYPSSESEGSDLGLLDPEGVPESVTKLDLEASGTMRLRPPTIITSDQKLLKVEVRGPFFLGDATEEAFEINSNPVQLSVLYQCESDGVVDVTLTLEHAVLTDAHRPEAMHLHWRKRCGLTAYRFMDVFLKSDLNKTKLQAAARGKALAGFQRPCQQPVPSRVKDGAIPRTTTPVATSQGCSSVPFEFEVDPKDSRTSIELKVDAAGQVSPPALQPQPDLSYDRRILEAKMTQFPHAASPGKSRPSTIPSTQHMAIRYSCHKEGVSVIMVTIHVLAHKPIDIAWRKRCSEPRVKVGKAMTAPQAMVFAMLILGFIGLVICMVFLLCSTDDEDKANLFQSADRGSKKKSDAKYSKIQKVSPDTYGAEAEEVVFHQ